MAFLDRWFGKKPIGKKRGSEDYPDLEREVYNPFTMPTDAQKGGGESGSTRSSQSQQTLATDGVVISAELRKEFDSSFGFFRFNFTAKSKAKVLMKWEERARTAAGESGEGVTNYARAVTQLITEYQNRNPGIEDVKRKEAEKQQAAAIRKEERRNIKPDLLKQFDASLGLTSFNFSDKSKARELMGWMVLAEVQSRSPLAEVKIKGESIQILVSHYLAQHPSVAKEYDKQYKDESLYHLDTSVSIESRASTTSAPISPASTSGGVVLGGSSDVLKSTVHLPSVSASPLPSSTPAAVPPVTAVPVSRASTTMNENGYALLPPVTSLTSANRLSLGSASSPLSTATSAASSPQQQELRASPVYGPIPSPLSLPDNDKLKESLESYNALNKEKMNLESKISFQEVLVNAMYDNYNALVISRGEAVAKTSRIYQSLTTEKGALETFRSQLVENTRAIDALYETTPGLKEHVAREEAEQLKQANLTRKERQVQFQVRQAAKTVISTASSVPEKSPSVVTSSEPVASAPSQQSVSGIPSNANGSGTLPSLKQLLDENPNAFKRPVYQDLLDAFNDTQKRIIERYEEFQEEKAKLEYTRQETLTDAVGLKKLESNIKMYDSLIGDLLEKEKWLKDYENGMSTRMAAENTRALLGDRKSKDSDALARATVTLDDAMADLMQFVERRDADQLGSSGRERSAKVDSHGSVASAGSRDTNARVSEAVSAVNRKSDDPDNSELIEEFMRDLKSRESADTSSIFKRPVDPDILNSYDGTHQAVIRQYEKLKEEHAQLDLAISVAGDDEQSAIAIKLNTNESGTESLVNKNPWLKDYESKMASKIEEHDRKLLDDLNSRNPDSEPPSATYGSLPAASAGPVPLNMPPSGQPIAPFNYVIMPPLPTPAEDSLKEGVEKYRALASQRAGLAEQIKLQEQNVKVLGEEVGRIRQQQMVIGRPVKGIGLKVQTLTQEQAKLEELNTKLRSIQEGLEGLLHIDKYKGLREFIARDEQEVQTIRNMSPNDRRIQAQAAEAVPGTLLKSDSYESVASAGSRDTNAQMEIALRAVKRNSDDPSEDKLIDELMHDLDNTPPRADFINEERDKKSDKSQYASADSDNLNNLLASLNDEENMTPHQPQPAPLSSSSTPADPLLPSAFSLSRSSTPENSPLHSASSSSRSSGTDDPPLPSASSSKATSFLSGHAHTLEQGGERRTLRELAQKGAHQVTPDAAADTDRDNKLADDPANRSSGPGMNKS